MSNHGVLNLLKPPGMTSHDAVAHVRRVLQIKRVGHTGTLDPAAAGVLLICVGQATRLVEALQSGTKEYLAEATFGYETDTVDAVGITVRECDASSINVESIKNACIGFRGSITQTPPMHSAIKVGGQKLYDIARSGGEIEIPTRPVEISLLEVTRFFDGSRPRAFLRIQCSSGTYIRSLVRDIGRALDNAATMTFLTRVCNGRFDLDRALTPDEFAADPALMGMTDILARLYGSIQVDDDCVHALWQGKCVEAMPAQLEFPEQQRVVWSNSEKNVFALAVRDKSNQWKPEKVFDLRTG